MNDYISPKAYINKLYTESILQNIDDTLYILDTPSKRINNFSIFQRKVIPNYIKPINLFLSLLIHALRPLYDFNLHLHNTKHFKTIYNLQEYETDTKEGKHIEFTIDINNFQAHFILYNFHSHTDYIKLVQVFPLKYKERTSNTETYIMYNGEKKSFSYQLETYRESITTLIQYIMPNVDITQTTTFAHIKQNLNTKEQLPTLIYNENTLKKLNTTHFNNIKSIHKVNTLHFKTTNHNLTIDSKKEYPSEIPIQNIHNITDIIDLCTTEELKRLQDKKELKDYCISHNRPYTTQKLSPLKNLNYTFKKILQHILLLTSDYNTLPLHPNFLQPDAIPRLTSLLTYHMFKLYKDKIDSLNITELTCIELISNDESSGYFYEDFVEQNISFNIANFLNPQKLNLLKTLFLYKKIENSPYNKPNKNLVLYYSFFTCNDKLYFAQLITDPNDNYRVKLVDKVHEIRQYPDQQAIVREQESPQTFEQFMNNGYFMNQYKACIQQTLLSIILCSDKGLFEEFKGVQLIEPVRRGFISTEDKGVSLFESRE